MNSDGQASLEASAAVVTVAAACDKVCARCAAETRTVSPPAPRPPA